MGKVLKTEYQYVYNKYEVTSVIRPAELDI